VSEDHDTTVRPTPPSLTEAAAAWVMFERKRQLLEGELAALNQAPSSARRELAKRWHAASQAESKALDWLLEVARRMEGP
jgi:aminoglycoside phosphotransferase (APT) family kinase protein